MPEAPSDAGIDPGVTQPPEQPRTSQALLIEELWQGLSEMRRPSSGLLISGLSAALDIGFSLFFVGVILTTLSPTLPGPVTRIAVANAYSAGFIFVILGRSEESPW